MRPLASATPLRPAPPPASRPLATPLFRAHVFSLLYCLHGEVSVAGANLNFHLVTFKAPFWQQAVFAPEKLRGAGNDFSLVAPGGRLLPLFPFLHFPLSLPFPPLSLRSSPLPPLPFLPIPAFSPPLPFPILSPIVCYRSGF